MGVARPDRSRLVVDIALPIRSLDPVFRHVAFCKFKDDGFSVIDLNDGVKMMRHIYSC